MSLTTESLANDLEPFRSGDRRPKEFTTENNHHRDTENTEDAQRRRKRRGTPLGTEQKRSTKSHETTGK
jgi:hypothetical protein